MKKRISFSLFVAVIWKGICQAFTFVGGLFGYKKNSSFAHFMWNLTSTSIAAILFVIAAVLMVEFTKDYIIEPANKYIFNGPTEWDYEFAMNDRLSFFECNEGNSYIFDKKKDKKLIKNVQWVTKNEIDYDSLCVYAKDGKRGYINLNTSEVEIPADTYTRAWLFSEGLAGVVKDGKLNFIDPHNNIVIKDIAKYSKNVYTDYIFKNGCCIIEYPTKNSGVKMGVINKKGKWILEPVYDKIERIDSSWMTWKDDVKIMLSNKFEILHDFGTNTVLTYADMIYVYDKENIGTSYMPDGKLAEYYVIDGVELLEYYTGEIRYEKTMSYDEDDNTRSVTDASTEVNVKANARCMKYLSGIGCYGLMSPEGVKITKPLYKDIEAIGPDLYRCSDGYGMGIIIDGKGREVN